MRVAWDADAANLRDLFRINGVPASTGALQLTGVAIYDDIGHVHPDSKRIVFDACSNLKLRAKPMAPPCDAPYEGCKLIPSTQRLDRAKLDRCAS